MKKIAFFLVVAAIVVAACKKSPYPGFEQTENGLFYQFHIQNKDAAKPKKGDIVVGELSIRLEDSLIFTNAGQPTRLFPVDSIYPGDLFEGVQLMGIGDSATFIVFADTIKKYVPMPQDVKPGAKFYYSIKLTEIISKEKVEAEQKVQMEAYTKQAEEAKVRETADIEKYIKEKKISAKPTESGLYYIETKKGSGAQAENGKTVKVEYTGMLLNGKVFDTSIKSIAEKAGLFNAQRQYEPIEFPLGEGRVIPGWEEGIAKMKVGGKAKFIIPSNIAYGARGAGKDIPPFSTLIFEVELKEVK
jgi:FKBP-type peptidyl-prolyl cis-trans isomerase FkpA